MWHDRRMEMTALLDALDRDSAAFVEACEVAGLSTPVASCPGWTVADLLWHLAEAHDFWGTVFADPKADPQAVPQPHMQPLRPVDEGLAALYRSGRDDLLATLGAADPSSPVWTWSADKTAGFVIRRMAHETAMHLWDATDAAGVTNPIEPALASDGIDEFLEHFLSNAATGAAPVGGSVHLHCGDVPGEWTVRHGDTGFDVVREHIKGDCAIRGTASDILLALWRRAPLAVCDVVGDGDVAARFIAHADLD
jgi:uncharacterized protein (TIGR03083 family)